MYEKTRICRVCKEVIQYKTKAVFLQAESRNSRCKSCAQKDNIVKYQGGLKGENNPFYGKTHTPEVRKMMGERDMTGWDMSRDTNGSKNPMFGKTIYGVWFEKYGKEEADKKKAELSKKLSKRNKGKNNPMYGKAPPVGSGNGCGGWYYGTYFRSLTELNYILYMEEKGIKWESAENKKYQVSYKDENGTDRTYRPDFFLINEKMVVECKPKKLQKTATNIAKKKAAVLFFKNRGLKYKMVDLGIVEQTVLDDLIKNGAVKMREKDSKNEPKRRSRRNKIRK